MGMSGRSGGLEKARAKMLDAGVDPVAIETFAHYYRLLEHGETGMIPESSIEPVDMDSLADVEVADDVAAEAIGKTVAIKLNGGLGTSMGMERAKSLLCVRRGLSFLDIIARQVLHQQALAALAGNDGSAVFAPFERGGEAGQDEAPFGVPIVVATVAVLPEDREDMGVEVGRIGGESRIRRGHQQHTPAADLPGTRHR